MAKRPKTTVKAGRVLTTRTLTPVARLTVPAVTINPEPAWHDRRLHNPARRVQPPPALTRSATRIVAADRLGDAVRRQTKAPLRFAVPNKVYLCHRRKTRAEVLHAMRKTGKGSGGRGRRNFWSSISCR